MNPIAAKSDDSAPHHSVKMRSLLIVGTGVMSVVTSALLLAAPWAPLAAIVAIVVGWLLLRHSDSATILVLFLIYSNLSVVAVKFHGLPFIMGAAVPLLLLIPLFDRLIIRREPIVFVDSLPWIALFLFIQFIGALFARFPEESLLVLLTFAIEGVGLFVLVTNLVRTQTMLRVAVWTLLAAGALIAVVPIYQQITNTHDNEYGGFGQTGERGFNVGDEAAEEEVRQKRAAGTIGEKNRYAQIMLMLVPLGLFCTAGERDRRLKWLALVGSLLIAAGAMLTFSRGAAVGFGLSFIIAVVLGYIDRRQAAAVVLGSVVLLLAFPQFIERLTSLHSLTDVLTGKLDANSEADGALTGRATEMGAAALVFVDHPILGVGPGMFKYYAIEYGQRIGLRNLVEHRQAHSLYLDVAAQHGILGLLALLAIVVVVLRGLARGRQQCETHHPYLARLSIAFTLVIIVYLMTGMFLHFAYVRYFWLMMGLAAATASIAQRAVPGDSISNPA